MEYTIFGNTGMKVSRFCVGGMTFGGKLDLQGVRRVVDEALDHGMNFIDTADSYGDSEEVLGQVLSKEKREKVFLATKVFRCLCRDGRVGRNSRVNIINALERSLRLLNTDYVDLYQLHHPDEETPVQETLATLDTIVKQGKARYVGVSNHYAWQMAYMLGESKAHGWAPIVSVQSNYSLADRQIEGEVMPFCRKFNIAIMCYSPLAGGFLTGKYQGLDKPPEGSRGASAKYLQMYAENETVQATIEELGRVASENDLKMNQAAILWLKAKPEATTIILGGSKPEHFTQIYEVADQELPEECVQRLDEVSAPRVYSPFLNQPMREGPGVARNR